MRNIKLTIQYDGSRYKGWQKLGNEDNTIQGKIEKVLRELTGEEIELIASGRTDAGVHAYNQIANFHTNSKILNKEILTYCYKYLPSDIVIKSLQEVANDFHSRYLAKKKIYIYKIYNGTFHDVFSRKYSYHVPEQLNIEIMKKAATIFIGKHDFKSFTALKSKKKSTIREIYSIDIVKKDNDIQIALNGNGFLHKMVRIIVGTLIQAGLEKITIEEIIEIMHKKDRSLASDTAPAHGLFLKEIIY
ncbi:tRNA pseudouridine synthase A [Clostridium homopropionicum DSM 5847]|uniref:tRNA pseudouridine synthase A n=1 Tax=Clostridium homopropionicum DSM 5847 TaxID=1121318 RepID=A0A0L6ZCE0_9CLOT|nr:tRNA pseudouridine(38-40) synthase TruA [Clostridium homopropionicum]KOA20468.1 tRNA pseudouridine synthase A [Clostridium homopropionicum DSM 5847]SFG35936.1 tRNA pseudouridine38-40 synthase [Clostridium homopropionicum]